MPSDHLIHRFGDGTNLHVAQFCVGIRSVSTQHQIGNHRGVMHLNEQKIGSFKPVV